MAATPPSTSRSRSNGCCRARRSYRKAGPSSAPPTSPPTSPRSCRPSPDLLFTSVWGGDYVALYKQALRYGLFDKMKVATTLAFGVAPHAHRQGSPRGRARRRALQLSLHLSGRRPLAAQQVVRAALLQALERIPELPVGRRLRHALHAQGRRSSAPTSSPAAGRRTRRSSASSRAWASTPRRATSTSGPTITRATRTR